jgi:hypothetical protein
LQHDYGGVGQVEPALQQAARCPDAAQQDRHRHDRQRIVTRQERHQDAGITVADGERGVGPAMHRRHLDHAGEPRRRAAGGAGQQHVAADIEAHHARGLGVAADHLHGEAPGREALEGPSRQAGDDAERQAPMHVGARNCPDHVGVADRPGRRLVETRWIAQRSLDEMVHQRDGDVGEQQAGDRLVDAAPLAQRAGQRDPESTHRHRRHGHGELDHERRSARGGNAGRGGRDAAHDQRALVADDDEAEPCRQRRAERGEDKRRGARQRVLPREPAAEGALIHQCECLQRVDAGIDEEQQTERDRRRQQGQRRNGNALEGLPHLEGRADHSLPSEAGEGAPTEGR